MGLRLSWRNFHWDNFFVFCWFLLLGGYLVGKREYPYIYDDEYGVLGAAAVLAGHEWTAPARMPFYGFGLSILIAPLYKLALEPGVLYRAVLFVNIVLVSASAAMCVAALRQLEVKISGLSRIGLAVTAFSYPAILFYAGLAMGETVLLFAFSLIVFSLSAMIGRRHANGYVFALMLGLGLGLAPYAHSRGLIFWLACLPVLGLAFYQGYLQKKLFVTTLGLASAIAATLWMVKGWLVEKFYVQVLEGTGSASEFIASRMELLDLEKLIVLGRVAWGQFAYLTTASFGLLPIAMVALVLAICRPQAHPMGSHCDPAVAARRRMVAALVFLSFVLMYGLSVVQMGVPVRADHFFYGRYNEVMMPPVLIGGLLLLILQSGRWKRAGWLLVGLAFSAVMMLGVWFFPPEIFERKLFWNPLTSWFVYIKGQWKVVPTDVALGVFGAGLLLLGVLILSRRLFLMTLCGMFLAAVLQNFDVQHRGGDGAWSWYQEIHELYAADMVGREAIVAQDNDFIHRLRGEALQFSMPGAKIKWSGNSADFVLQPGGGPCPAGLVGHEIRGNLICHSSDISPVVKKESAQVQESPAPGKNDGVRIEILNENISAGTMIDRFCAITGEFFYSAWARYCLPVVSIRVTSIDLAKAGNGRLGLFVTDEKGKWVKEMRADMTAGRGQEVIRIPLRFDWRIPPGNYTLNAAIINKDGWNWQTKASAALSFE